MATTMNQPVAKTAAIAIAAAAAAVVFQVVTGVTVLVVGALDGHLLLSVVVGELVLALVSFVAAIVMVIRWRASAGIGVMVGWIGGVAGAGAAAVAVFVACVAFGIIALGLMLVSYFI
jgi:hypothetical protein